MDGRVLNQAATDRSLYATKYFIPPRELDFLFLRVNVHVNLIRWHLNPQHYHRMATCWRDPLVSLFNGCHEQRAFHASPIHE